MSDYYELAQLADRLLEISDDDVEKLAGVLDILDPDVRDELLVSDLFNACQVFFYYFREVPDILARERLILEPASECATGVLAGESDLYEIIFGVRNGTPIITVSDGDRVVARFSGANAYRKALAFIDENPD